MPNMLIMITSQDGDRGQTMVSIFEGDDMEKHAAFEEFDVLCPDVIREQ